MRPTRFLSYGKQAVDELDRQAVDEVLRGDWLTQGETVPAFERALADYVGAKYCVAVNSGTSALHIAQLACGMDQTKTGLTSALTFVASANAPIYCGGNSVLGDIDADTLCLSPRFVEAAIGRDDTISAVTPVHFAGYSADVAQIRTAAPNAVIIEDACHALGAQDKDGRNVGSCADSDMACFSFHPVKPVTTGEGGAVTTNDDVLYEKLLRLRNHGITRDPDNLQHPDQAAPWYYEQQELGFNYRLTDIQAALGLSQMKKLERFTQRRREIAGRYDEVLGGLENLTLTQSAPEMRARSSHHLYVVGFDFETLNRTRAEVMGHLRDQNIGSQVHYIPVYRQPYHQNRQENRAGDVADAFPNTEAYYSQALSLPIFPSMTDEEVNWVASCVQDIVS